MKKQEKVRVVFNRPHQINKGGGTGSYFPDGRPYGFLPHVANDLCAGEDPIASPYVEGEEEGVETPKQKTPKAVTKKASQPAAPATPVKPDPKKAEQEGGE